MNLAVSVLTHFRQPAIQVGRPRNTGLLPGSDQASSPAFRSDAPQRCCGANGMRMRQLPQDHPDPLQRCGEIHEAGLDPGGVRRPSSVCWIADRAPPACAAMTRGCCRWRSRASSTCRDFFRARPVCVSRLRSRNPATTRAGDLNKPIRMPEAAPAVALLRFECELGIDTGERNRFSFSPQTQSPPISSAHPGPLPLKTQVGMSLSPSGWPLNSHPDTRGARTPAFLPPAARELPLPARLSLSFPRRLRTFLSRPG